MAIMTKAELEVEVAAQIADNNNREITPAKVRTLLGKMLEASLTSEKTCRTAEYFGCVAVPPDSDPNNTPDGLVNNLTAIQDAIDWSASVGGVVIFGHGVYGVSGTIRPKSHMTIIGQGQFVTEFRQMSAKADVFAPLITDAAVDGVSFVTMRNIRINGAWDKYGSGGAWNYTFEEMTQVGLRLTGPQLSSASADLNRFRSIDTLHDIANVSIWNIAGTGLDLGGRGDAIFHHLYIKNCALDGINHAMPDAWLADVAISAIGRNGIVSTAGNQRWRDIKPWFIGMSKGVEPDGCGIKFNSAGMTNFIGSGLTTQDTYGPGISVQGIGLKLSGNIDEAAGGRLKNQGNGWQGTRTKSNSALEIVNADYCSLDFSIEGSTLNANTPYLVDFNGSGSVETDVVIEYDRAATVWYNSSPVRASGGYTTAKRNNRVRTKDGIWLHGFRTQAELGDAAHGVNINKGLGYHVQMDDGRIAVKTGALATSPWVTPSGTAIVTPA